MLRKRSVRYTLTLILTSTFIFTVIIPILTEPPERGRHEIHPKLVKVPPKNDHVNPPTIDILNVTVEFDDEGRSYLPWADDYQCAKFKTR